MFICLTCCFNYGELQRTKLWKQITVTYNESNHGRFSFIFDIWFSGYDIYQQKQSRPFLITNLRWPPAEMLTMIFVSCAVSLRLLNLVDAYEEALAASMSWAGYFQQNRLLNFACHWTNNIHLTFPLPHAEKHLWSMDQNIDSFDKKLDLCYPLQQQIKIKK